MSDISLSEAMKRVERLNPRWEYSRKHGHQHLSFETTTPDGPVSVLIQKGFSSMGTSSPITYEGFSLSITLNGCVIFGAFYDVKYRSGWFGGPERPHYSKEYICLEEYFEKHLRQHEAREQAEREDEARKRTDKKRADELNIQKERKRFFGR